MTVVYIYCGLDRIRSWPFWRAVLAEFLGTTLFLMAVTSVALPWDNRGKSANNVEIGIGIGLAIASLAQAFGHVSGGHLNPAVTLGMVVGGETPVVIGLFYMFAQVLGAMAGSGITYVFAPSAQRSTFGVTSLGPGVTPAQGFGLELLFTFLLVFFIFSITDKKKKTEPYGTTLGIGVVILVCHVCLIPFTGCGINPARSFGPAVAMNKWSNHWVYWIGPFTGAVMAAIFYKFIFYVTDAD